MTRGRAGNYKIFKIRRPPKEYKPKKSVLIDQEELQVIHSRIFNCLREIDPLHCGRLMKEMLSRYTTSQLLEYLDDNERLKQACKNAEN
jgi:hypothetical protein